MERRTLAVMTLLRERGVLLQMPVAGGPGHIVVRPDDNALHGLAVEIQHAIYSQPADQLPENTASRSTTYTSDHGGA